MITNRKEEFLALKDFINKKHIDTYGNIGIGKTAFLHFLCNKICCGKHLPIRIELLKVNNFTEFLEIIAETFDDFFLQENYFSIFREYIYGSRDYNTDIAGNLFSAALSKATESTSIALCFDSTEKVPCKIWKDFEENILRFHLGIGDGADSKLQIITAGQWRMRWHFFRMRDHVVLCHLDLFGKESTSKIIQQVAKKHEIDLGIENKKNIIDDIYSLTLGHPKSIKLIIQSWKDLQPKHERYQKGIATLLKKYIQPEVIAQAKRLVKDEHYPASKSLLNFLQHLTPLRFISTKVLRETLSHLSSFSSFYSKQRSFFFNKLLRTLQDEHLLDWNEDRERYEFPAIVQHILLEDLKQNETENLIKIHQEIENVYQKLTFEGVVDRHAAFIEQLYHTISWQEIDNAKRKGGHDLEKTLWNEIDKYLKKYGEAATSLRSLLETDNYFNKMMNWENFFRAL
ncbi:hypothetical protein KKHLCK_09195 [Candidatus Electrothrix laxa]